MINSYTTKVFPVSRIGNEKSPKLIILLCNPGGDPKYYKRLAEYPMDKDGFYKSSGMDLHIYREYCEWWDKVLNKTDKHGIKDKDILALEYYPYHTKCSNDSKHWEWDTFAQKSLSKNKELLLKHIRNGVPVFGYYYGFWLNDKDINKQLSMLKPMQFYKSRNGLGQSLKLKDLDDWLHKTRK